MPRRRRLLAVAVALAVVASTLAVGPGALPGAHAGDSGNETNDTPTFLWEAPKNLTGTLAVEVQLHFQHETTCEALTAAEGTVREDIPLLFWERQLTRSPGGRLETLTYSWLRNRERVHAHAAGVETGPATPWDFGPYNAGSSSVFTLQENLTRNITVVAFGLEERSDRPLPYPMHIYVDCDQPVDVELRASRQARGFTEQAFTDGGAGASITATDDDILVQRNATVETAFDTELARLQGLMRLWDGSPPEGHLRLHHPDGTRSWGLNPSDHFPRNIIGHAGGPGNYTAELTATGRADTIALAGVLAGLDPVDSLDDVPRTCDPNNPLGEPVDCLPT